MGRQGPWPEFKVMLDWQSTRKSSTGIHKSGGKMPPYLRTSTKLPFFGGRFRGTLGRSNLSHGQRFVHNVDGEASAPVGLLLEINHPRWDSECTKFFDKLCIRRGVMYQEGIFKK
jgi:hypothetical protein